MGLQACTNGGTVDVARLEHNVSQGAGEILRRIQAHEIMDDVESLRAGVRLGAVEAWCRDLREHHDRRQLSAGLKRLAHEIETGTAAFGEQKSALLSLISKTDTQKGGLRHVSEYVPGALQQLAEWEQGQDTSSVQTGIYTLDRVTGGLPVGELSLMAAVSGAGKTSFLLQVLRQVAARFLDKQEGQAVALFSIEMSARQVVQRIASGLAGTNLREIRSCTASDEMLTRHDRTLDKLKDWPLYIDESAYPTIDHIRQTCATLQAQHDLALIGVDYDEKVNVSERSEELRVGRIAKGLKVLAKETHSAVLSLSQYNSAPDAEARPGTDADLRYSRKKHHESSLIMHWHWPKYFVNKGVNSGSVKGYEAHDPTRGRLTVSKNRFGPVGHVPLRFEEEHTRFVDINEPSPNGSHRAKVTPLNDSPF
jgi:replicative DNA helicase